jgi:hypothetical protein
VVGREADAYEAAAGKVITLEDLQFFQRIYDEELKKL